MKLQRAEAALVARLAGTLRFTPRSTWSRTPQLIASKKPWDLGGGGGAPAPVNEFRGWGAVEAKEKRDGEPPPGAA